MNEMNVFSNRAGEMRRGKRVDYPSLPPPAVLRMTRITVFSYIVAYHECVCFSAIVPRRPMVVVPKCVSN